jgi:predicted Zn-dependent peptidase
VLGIETTLEEHLRNIAAVTLDEVIEVARSVTLDTVYLLEGTLSGEDDEEEYDE